MSEFDIIPSVDAVGLASSVSGAITSVLLWVLIIFLVGATIGAVIWWLSFKHRVRVKHSIRGRTVIIEDKARIVKDKNGSMWWKFLKTRLKVSPPPSEAIDIGRKGRFFTEGYLLEDGRFVWRIDDFDSQSFKDDAGVKYDKSFTGKYHFFTSKERALLANEVVEAQQYKKRKFLDVLVAIAPYLAIIIIFVLFLVFFDSVVSPAVELGNTIKAGLDTQLETMRIVQSIVQGKESMLLNGTVVPN